MQKKQLRTIAIIALVAIFVIGSIMKLTIEPADLGRGDKQDPSQVVQTLPTDGDVTDESGENTDNVGGNEDENNSDNDDVSGGDTTAVSDAEKSDQNEQQKDEGKDDTAKTDTSKTDTSKVDAVKTDTTKTDTSKTDTSKTDTSKTDTSKTDTNQTDTVNKDNITADSAATKPEMSSVSGTKPGAWPPIPAQTVADPNNPQTYHCTMEIYCTTLLNEENIDNEAIIPYIPEDGVILPKTTIQFTEGENAFDVILRACRDNDIQFEFREDSLYSGVYVEGINYLYEFDGGPLSGWMYKVNGQFPNYGCKRYYVQDGDAIVWVYTCDLGRDVGDNSVW